MLHDRSVYGGTGMITEELRWPRPVLALGPPTLTFTSPPLQTSSEPLLRRLELAT